jgi:hypothetical protein
MRKAWAMHGVVHLSKFDCMSEMVSSPEDDLTLYKDNINVLDLFSY